MTLDREKLRQDLLRCFPESWGSFCFADDIPEISEPLLIIRAFSTSGSENSMKVSLAFELKPILDKTLTSKCWITTKEVQVLRHYPDYKEFKYEGDVFYPYSAKFVKYAGNVSAETLRTICTNIYDRNITK